MHKNTEIGRDYTSQIIPMAARKGSSIQGPPGSIIFRNFLTDAVTRFIYLIKMRPSALPYGLDFALVLGEKYIGKTVFLMHRLVQKHRKHAVVPRNIV